MSNNKPNIAFFGIGVPKAATTWVTACLREHPEICSSLPKETDFFLSKHENTSEFSHYFEACEENALAGEFSLYYLYSDTAYEQIKIHFPEAKIFLVVRDPIERARSLYEYRRVSAKEVGETFEEEIETKPHYIEQGKYYYYLKQWIQDFTHIHVIVYEDIENNPRKVIEDLYAFLGVNQNFTPPSLGEKKNVTAQNRHRSRFLHHFITATQRIAGTSAILSPLKPFWRLIRAKEISKKIRSMNHRPHKQRVPIEKAPMSEETRKRLAAYYQADTKELEAYLNRSLPWLK